MSIGKSVSPWGFSWRVGQLHVPRCKYMLIPIILLVFLHCIFLWMIVINGIWFWWGVIWDAHAFDIHSSNKTHGIICNIFPIHGRHKRCGILNTKVETRFIYRFFFNMNENLWRIGNFERYVRISFSERSATVTLDTIIS